MGAITSAEEDREHDIAVMGKETGEIFFWLKQDLIWLYLTWNEFVALYGSKAEQVELLNESAGQFFAIAQDALANEALLGISRLTDRAGSGETRNLSIQALVVSLADQTARERFGPSIADARTAAAFARKWRNKHIAHRDLKTALANLAQLLEPATKDKISRALESIARLLNEVAASFGEPPTAFDPKPLVTGAEELLLRLRDAQKLERYRERKYDQGEVDLGELDPD